MVPKTEQHEGFCEHCRTAVHLQAKVCTGCGAVWGLKDGESRESLYGKYKTSHRICQVLFYGGLIGLWLLFHYKAEWTFRILLVIILFYLSYFLLIASSCVSEAKKGKVAWWR